MSCSRLPVGRKRRVHSLLPPGFEKNMFGLFILQARSTQAAALHIMLSEINEFLGRITTEGIVISGEKVKKRMERKRRGVFGDWKKGLVRHGFH